MQKIVVLIFFIFSLSSYANEVVVEKEDITQSYKNIKIESDKDFKDSSALQPSSVELQKVDLIDVVLQTLLASHKVKSTREKMIQAKEDVDIAYANYYPSVDASYSLTKTQLKPGDKKPDKTLSDSKYYGDEILALKLSQNIYAGGETQNDIQRLKSLYQLSKVEFKKLLETEVQKAVTSYVDVLFSKESLEVSDKNIKELEKIFDIVKTKYDAGALSVGELSNIEASISNAKSQYSRTNSKYINSLDYFEFIVGEVFHDAYPHEKITKVELKDFDSLLESSLVNNSELQALDYQVLSNKYNLKKLKSAFRPKIDFVAGAEKIMDKEDFEHNEDKYYAKIVLNYNLYNGGRDEKQYLKAFSKIKEKMFDKKAEIRRIKWGLEKFHTSLTSLQDNMDNAQKEVDASTKMVESYWESFRNGEQDLYVLLEAQRQLNTAELNLIQNQQDSMKDYFEILLLSGELLEYFQIDIENESFLDMAKTAYREQHKEALQKEETEYVVLDNTLEIVDINTSTKPVEVVSLDEIEQHPVSMKPALDGILSFHENFLLQDPQSYTIVISKFDNSIDALKMIDKLGIEDSAFIYQSHNDKKIQTNIAYGIFEIESDAIIAKDKLKSDKKTKVELIKKVQKNFKEFTNLLFVDAGELEKYKELLAQKELKFQTDVSFKERFLTASEDNFTINITTLASMEIAGKVIEDANIADNSFAFYFGQDKKWVKLMMGVYPSYEDASSALEALGKLKTEYMPVIEKISSKQKLYRKFNEQ
ncbi:MAG: TolC family protein [Sulfurimonas sp.]|nr:TolC family protein [Sulfurimonas sp.]